MKRKLVSLAAVLCGAAVVNGADETVKPELVNRAVSYMTANPAVEYHTTTPEKRPLTIGRSNVRVTGPLVETFRPARLSQDAGVMDRLTSVPILGLFVPQPMPRPPAEKGRYFAWGQSDRAWADLADHAIPGPQTGLVSFSK